MLAPLTVAIQGRVLEGGAVVLRRVAGQQLLALHEQRHVGGGVGEPQLLVVLVLLPLRQVRVGVRTVLCTRTRSWFQLFFIFIRKF